MPPEKEYSTGRKKDGWMDTIDCLAEWKGYDNGTLTVGVMCRRRRDREEGI